MTRRGLALLALLCAAHSSLAYNVYKSVDAQGNVTYSSKPLGDAAAVERVKLPPAPSQASVAAANQREQEIAAAGKELSKDAEARKAAQAGGVDARRREVNQAQAALAEAKQMGDSDWQGTVQGKRHLKPEYFDRVAVAESRLQAAQRAYKQALAARGN